MNAPKNLTTRQFEVLAFCIKYVHSCHRFPTGDVVSECFGFKSTNAPVSHFKYLVTKGYLYAPTDENKRYMINWAQAKAVGLPYFVWHAADTNVKRGDLTRRQFDILCYCIDFFRKYQSVPTTRGGARGIGVTSNAGVKAHFGYLAAKGYLIRATHKGAKNRYRFDWEKVKALGLSHPVWHEGPLGPPVAENFEMLALEVLLNRDARVAAVENDMRRRFGAVFGEARKERGLSMREMAEEIGTSHSQVERVLHHEAGGSLSLRTLVRAADALGLIVEIDVRKRVQEEEL